MEAAGIEQVPIALEEVIGRVSAHDIADPKTGEVLVECNQEITQERYDLLRERGITEIEVLFIDDLHVGPSLRNTLLQDKIASARRGDPRDLPAPASRRSADARDRAPPSSTTCSSIPTATISRRSAG